MALPGTGDLAGALGAAAVDPAAPGPATDGNPREQAQRHSSPEAWQTADAPVVVEDIRWQPEVRMLIRLAAPTIVQGAAQQAMMVTDQVFVGHLGTNALAAAALATTYSNIMWFFLLGSSTALDTLGAQAFGAGNHPALITATFTSAVVQTVLCFGLSVALCFGKLVAANLFGQDDDVASMVGQYCYGLIPGMWPLVLGLTLMKFLQTQNMMLLPALITVAAFLLNVAFNAAFIALMGFKGAPLATSLSRFCQFVLLVFAVRHTERKRRAALADPGADAPGQEATDREGAQLQADNEKRCLERGSEDGSPQLSRSSTSRAGGDGGTEVTGPGAGLGAAAGSGAAAGANGDHRGPLSGYEPQGRRSKDGHGGDAELLLLELQPLYSAAMSKSHGPGPAGNTSACSGHAATPGAPAWQPRRLQKQLSWFRAPSWRMPRLRGGEPVGGSGFGRNGGGFGGGIDEGTDGGGGSARGVGVGVGAVVGSSGSGSDGSVPGVSAARYLLSEAKAAMQPHLLSRYLRLALPGGFMLAFEAASFDVTTGMAGHLGSVETAAHAAVLGIIYFTYSALPWAISTAATIRVGNLLGSGMPRLARKSGYLSIVMTIACVTPVAIAIFAARNVLGRAFSGDSEVIATMAVIAPYAALLQIADGIMGPSQGVLRGCGRQLQLMFSNVLAFWLMGVFLGYMLTFRAGLGVRGLWIGIMSGDFTAACFNLGSLSFVNWDKEAVTAAARVTDMAQPAAATDGDGSSKARGGGAVERSDVSHRRRKGDRELGTAVDQC